MNKYKFLTKIVSTFSRCFDVSPKVFIPKPKVFSQNGSQRRYGTRASLSIDLTKRNWFDHEQKEGGLLKTLITRQTNLLAKDWLFSEGFIL